MSPDLRRFVPIVSRLPSGIYWAHERIFLLFDMAGLWVDGVPSWKPSPKVAA